MPIDNFLKILEEISLELNKDWRFINKPKNILFLCTKRKENFCNYVDIPNYNIFEYLIKGEKDKRDLIFELNLLCLNKHIDAIFCEQDTIDLAKKLNDISLGRRGLLRKEIIIVCKDKIYKDKI